LVTSVPGIEFGIAFCEASGRCRVRIEANNDELRNIAVGNALAIGAGHMFFIAVRRAFPINLLPRIKAVPEVCTIFCATANSVQVLVAESKQGKAILGVIDGKSPEGIETVEDISWRRDFLRTIGYKK